MEIIIFLAKLALLLFAFVGEQFLVKRILKCLNDRVKNASDSIYNFIQEIEEKEEKKFKEKKFNFNNFYIESTASMLLKKREGADFTPIIGSLEFIIFAGLTYLLIKNNYGGSFLEIIKILATFVSGWIALKIFGSYQQWKGTILGRSCFYIFLIGSVLNIALVIFLGWCASLMF